MIVYNEMLLAWLAFNSVQEMIWCQKVGLHTYTDMVIYTINISCPDDELW